jgi:hypothetical protein
LRSWQAADRKIAEKGEIIGKKGINRRYQQLRVVRAVLEGQVKLRVSKSWISHVKELTAMLKKARKVAVFLKI